jgi:hypothetical protein
MKFTESELREIIKEELMSERSGVTGAEIKQARLIIKKHLKQMFDEIGRDKLPEKFSTEILIQPILDKWSQGRRGPVKAYNPLTRKMTN